MKLSRRYLLNLFSAAVPAAVLVSCTSTTTNGVTTETINLATVNAYATAIENGANTLLAIPLISAAMGPSAVSIVSTATKGVASAISTLNTVYKGQISFSFTVANTPAALDALVTDANQINGAVSAITASAGSEITANEQEIIDALQTVVSTLIALVTGAVGAAETPLPIGAALLVLGVTQ